MPVFKRARSAHRTSTAGDLDEPLLLPSNASLAQRAVVPTIKARRRQLLPSDQVPSWYAQNEYIRSGYRPVTESVYLCFQSLGYLHNESVNIYSHLIPAALALLGNYLLGSYFSSRFPLAVLADRLVFHVYLTTSVGCFGISSAYHCLLCHSEHYADLWVRLDYVAIVFQILGSLVSGVYIGFYCEPHLQKTYWALVVSLGVVTGLVVVHPRLQGNRWQSLRTSSFVATGLSAFAPIIHAASIFPYQQLDKQAGLTYYYVEGLSILIGVVFYTLHFPESWKAGKFDIWGASHQIFHGFVVLGAVIHFCGLVAAFEWNYVNQRCE